MSTDVNIKIAALGQLLVWDCPEFRYDRDSIGLKVLRARPYWQHYPKVTPGNPHRGSFDIFEHAILIEKSELVVRIYLYIFIQTTSASYRLCSAHEFENHTFTSELEGRISISSFPFCISALQFEIHTIAYNVVLKDH